MSRPFWVTTAMAAALVSVLINRWADTWVDAAIILTMFIWATFCLALVDVWKDRGGS